MHFNITPEQDNVTAVDFIEAAQLKISGAEGILRALVYTEGGGSPDAYHGIAELLELAHKFNAKAIEYVEWERRQYALASTEAAPTKIAKRKKVAA